MVFKITKNYVDRKICNKDVKPLRSYDEAIDAETEGSHVDIGVDIAKKLDNLGHLISLRRLSIGNVSVNDANNFDSLKDGNVNLIPICKALSFKNLHT